MSLIFDQFPSTENAEAFVAEVKRCFDLDGQVFATDEAAYAADARPWESEPPIVHIDRFDIDWRDGRAIDHKLEVERNVEERASEHVEKTSPLGGRPHALVRRAATPLRLSSPATEARIAARSLTFTD